MVYMRTLKEAEIYKRLDLREMGLAFFPREICTLTMLIDLSLSRHTHTHTKCAQTMLIDLSLISNEMCTIPPDISPA